MRSGSHPSATAGEIPPLGLVPLIALSVAGAALTGLAAVVALTGDMPHNVGLAERQAVVVGTPIAVGLYAWRVGSHARFGRLLVIAGVAWFFAALASSSNEVLYSIGRVAGWTVEAGLVCLVLAFPSGRLTAPVDRRLAAAAVGVVALLFLPTALIADDFPVISLYSGCTDCPGNAFMLLGSEPAWLDDYLIPLRELLAALILIAVVARLVYRIRHATRLMRWTLMPVLVIATVRTLGIAVLFGMRRAGVDDSVLDAGATIVALGLPAMCIGFLVGLVRWQLHTANALMNLALALRGEVGLAERRELVASTLGDPTVELAFRDGDASGWVDAGGHAVALPPESPNRHVTLISNDEGPVAGVIHDAALREQRPFVEAVVTYAFIAEENRRLAANVQRSLSELRASRARILAAADDERRRIERDLHDGGQQRLVALRIRLELAEQMMAEDPSRGRSMLHRLGEDIDAALDELRSLAAGVFPSLLAARGLPEALRTAALQSPVPTVVVVEGTDRYASEVETAAYFCCIEALQNVAKHAPDARSVSISIRRNGDLRFEVRDDGGGFALDETATGAGLANMRDRISAVGGDLRVQSGLGAGTTVTGTIPALGSATPELV
jgi:signal transduction histidine kinase